MPEGFLLNLSLLAATFSAVSALVMLLRQTMGGKLSPFDIHLIATYVAVGFVIAVSAVLPPLMASWDLGLQLTWLLASGISAVFFVWYTVSLIRRRRRVSAKTPALVYFDWACFGVTITALTFNALSPGAYSGALHASALCFILTIVLWSFVRRLMTLLTGAKPGDDWDPARG